jgi:hypothetical protein
MSRIKRILTAAGLCMVSASSALALDVAFFDNATYTDPPQESALLIASLNELGHTEHVFSGIDAADWLAATTGVDLLIIPELDNGSLYPDLSPDARQAIFDYVNNGGGLIMFDRSDDPTPAMLNGIFGFSLVGGGGGVTTLNAAAAAGTPFEGGPASLPDPSATELFLTSSLPGGALDLYNDGVDETSVFWVAQGAGRIGYLAFDWFEDPSPAEWEEVLGRMVSAVTGTPGTRPVGVPSLNAIGLLSLALLSLALGAVTLRRRAA